MDFNLISRLVLDFQAYENTLEDKWLTMDTWLAILRKYYGLGTGINFTKQRLTKSILSLGPVTMSGTDGNITNIFLHQDAVRHQSKRITFMCLSSTRSEPQKPANAKEWRKLLPLSTSVQENMTQERNRHWPYVPSIDARKTLHSTRTIDHEIDILHRQPLPAGDQRSHLQLTDLRLL